MDGWMGTDGERGSNRRYLAAKFPGHNMRGTVYLETCQVKD